MDGAATRCELTVRSGGVSLAGTLWLPGERPAAVVLMHPGSGASDRDNDTYFPPIRERLLASGIGACSFDKRGVGGSTGRWQDAAIEAQAVDALACVEALISEPSFAAPVGLFGHSQGGWVVVDAAGRRPPKLAFVVTNSGPAVTPAEQERYATRAYMTRAGMPETQLAEVGRYFDRLLTMMRDCVPFEEVQSRIDEDGFPEAFKNLGLPFLPDDAADWDLMAALADYDPRPALERIQVPLLALFGDEDSIVPVEESARVYREAVRPDLLTVAVLPGADHRLQTGEPAALAEDYHYNLASFVLRAVA